MTLRQLRLAAGLTQEEVAAKLKIRQCNISRWETDGRKPHPHHYKKLAKLYHCTTKELAQAEPEKVVKPYREEAS